MKGFILALETGLMMSGWAIPGSQSLVYKRRHRFHKSKFGSMAPWFWEGHDSRMARVSPLKHRAQGRGLIQVEDNTAFSHGCAKI